MRGAEAGHSPIMATTMLHPHPYFLGLTHSRRLVPLSDNLDLPLSIGQSVSLRFSRIVMREPSTFYKCVIKYIQDSIVPGELIRQSEKLGD
jgi:hypothetical protein